MNRMMNNTFGNANYTVYTSDPPGIHYPDSDSWVSMVSTNWQGGYDCNAYKPVEAYSTDWECEYCARLNPANLYQCDGCAAARRKEYA